VIKNILFVVGGNSLKWSPKSRLNRFFSPLNLHDKKRVIDDVQSLQESCIQFELILEIVGVEATDEQLVLNTNKIKILIDRCW